MLLRKPVVKRLKHQRKCTLLPSVIFFFFFQVKNGEALPPGPLPRAQRPPHTPSKKPAGGGETGREEAEQKALLAVQCSLLKILSKTLATLQHFTPDCCQILLDQVGCFVFL